MIVATCSVQRKSAFSLLFPTRTRVQCFSIFAFTPSLFGCKTLINCVLRVKASPFCLHLFFAMNVVQGVELQVVAVKVKVNARFAFTLKLLIYSLLRGEVKGEGKNDKLAERASAYIRVGACPARRIEWEFVRVGRFWEKQGRKSRKVEKFWEKVGLYFSSGVGEGEKNNLSCSVVLGLFCVVRLLFDFVLWLFRDGLVFFDPGCPVSTPPFPFWFYAPVFWASSLRLSRRSVLFLLLCPRFVAFSLTFPLALSFFQRKMSVFISIRLFKGVKYDFFLLFLACKSRNSGELQAKTPRQTDFFGAKWDFGQENPVRKREKHPEKGGFCPQSGRIGRKRAVLGGKSQGGDEAKNRALLPILPCYEVAKWAQMNFSRIFFRWSLAGNGEMPYLCTRNREATLLQERELRSEGNEAAKVLLWSLKVLHNRL